MKDTYKTILKPSLEVLYKEKGSKFLATAFPLTSEADVAENIKKLQEKHHKARHFCYAWQLGTVAIRFRANDDGEPNNSAGMPIYGQIQSFHVTNVLIVVVRYFGGTKLGVGGLISAYKIAAKMALEESVIVEKTINVQFQLSFQYAVMNKVMRIIKTEKLQIVSQKMESECVFIIAVRKNNSEKVKTMVEGLRCVKLITPNP